MIHTSTGSDVGGLLERLIAHPERYAEVVLCTPFIDAEMIPRLVRLSERARRSNLAATVITSPASAAALRTRLSGNPASWRGLIAECERLHAKVYLALGRQGDMSEAIVTSANLTLAGVSRNIELGVRALSNSDGGRQFISEVRHFVRRIAA